MGGFSSNQTGLVFFIKSQWAFYVLFCEQKEGTIIANDSHLRGDTMLNIYFGDMPEAVYNTSVYFNYTYEDEWLTSDFAKEVIKKIDKSDVKGPHAVESPVLGSSRRKNCPAARKHFC